MSRFKVLVVCENLRVRVEGQPEPAVGFYKWYIVEADSVGKAADEAVLVTGRDPKFQEIASSSQTSSGQPRLRAEEVKPALDVEDLALPKTGFVFFQESA